MKSLFPTRAPSALLFIALFFEIESGPARQPANAQEPAPASSGTRLVLLGTGTPNADPERSGPSLAIVASGKAYLVDAGPGVVRRAAAAAKRGVPELAVDRLDTVFLTHLHSDHTVGLPDLIFTPWVLERRRPLRILGPPGTKDLARHLAKAFQEDVAARLTGLEPANKTGYRVEARDLAPGLVLQEGNVRVTAFQVPHGIWKHAFGYRFETGDRTIAVSGDTTPSDAVVTACSGCDLLVHEVYSEERFKTRPPEWQRYHRSAHTSTKELAEIARKAKPKQLLLTHQLFWGATDEDLVKEIRAAGYEGAVASGRDLDVY